MSQLAVGVTDNICQRGIVAFRNPLRKETAWIRLMPMSKYAPSYHALRTSQLQILPLYCTNFDNYQEAWFQVGINGDDLQQWRDFTSAQGILALEDAGFNYAWGNLNLGYTRWNGFGIETQILIDITEAGMTIMTTDETVCLVMSGDVESIISQSLLPETVPNYVAYDDVQMENNKWYLYFPGQLPVHVIRQAPGARYCYVAWNNNSYGVLRITL